VRVYVVENDLLQRGIEPEELTPGVKLMRAEQLPRLLGEYEAVWNW
jgi:sulfur relay (sulfurtransferase) DsrF/TusC family protein